MRQDVVSDGLNQIMNAKKARKTEVVLKRYSKTLLGVLAIAKIKGYIGSYKVEDKMLRISFAKLNDCNAIKPRFTVGVKEVEKYVKRFLPARDIGVLIISTSKGLMTHQTAYEKNLGGSLVAYFY